MNSSSDKGKHNPAFYLPTIYLYGGTTMSSFLIIADDFSGSSDTGVNMVKNGIETHIIFDASKMTKGKSYVIDTESRNISAEKSYEIVRTVAEFASKLNFNCYYKKIDSTLRGNICTEIKAIVDVLKSELIVFNPASPNSGRTVVHGDLYMSGTLVTETEIANDPFFFCKESNIRRMMETQMNESIQHFDIKSIRDGLIQWNGSKIVTFDAEVNDDIDKVVKYILELGKNTLWVGSAGMANSLFKILSPQKPSLAIVGSIADTSRNQVKYAEEQGAHVIKGDICSLLRGESLLSIIEKAVYKLQLGNDVIISSAYDYQDYVNSIKYGAKLGLRKEEVSLFTQRKLGEIGIGILEEVQVAGVFLTGGETAANFVKSAGCDSCKIISEPLPVVPVIELDTGKHSGLRAVAKGGSIGGKETIDYCFELFRENNYI